MHQHGICFFALCRVDPTDITNNKGMAILAYFGLLVLIPIFAAKHSKFARFPSNQGLVLMLADIVSGIVNAIILAISWRLYFLTSIISFLSIVFAVLCIIGIVNAANGRAKELPTIGKIKIIKQKSRMQSGSRPLCIHF